MKNTRQPTPETASDADTIRRAMSILGSRTSPLKAQTSRENGLLGGRPKKRKARKAKKAARA